MEKQITQRMKKAIAEHIFPGCVVGVLEKSQTLVLPFGGVSYEPHAAPVTETTIYDVASITKAIPTSSLALLLLQEGKLQLDDKLIQFVPECQSPFREKITLWHLLTQTIDFIHPLSKEKSKSAEEVLQAVLHAPIGSPPGSGFVYTNTTSILLGMLIERVTGMTLNQAASRYFFQPLGMADTTFTPEQFAGRQIAPTEIDEWRGEVRGVVHDESAYTLREKMLVGSAGLFSTVPDLLTFVGMLLQKGEYQGRRYFSEEMIDRMSRNQLESEKGYTSLGWELKHHGFMGQYASEQTFGKTGFTGCSVVVDIPRQIGIVLLSNSTYPKRPKDRSAVMAVRGDLADIVFSRIS